MLITVRQFHSRHYRPIANFISNATTRFSRNLSSVVSMTKCVQFEASKIVICTVNRKKLQNVLSCNMTKTFFGVFFRFAVDMPILLCLELYTFFQATEAEARSPRVQLQCQCQLFSVYIGLLGSGEGFSDCLHAHTQT